MPEYPDIQLYLHALRPRVVGEVMRKVRIKSPFLLQSVGVRPSEAEGLALVGLRRLGKRIVWEFEGDLRFVFHLMIAGRFQWKPPEAKLPGKLGLAAFDFDQGTLLLTEASSHKRAHLHVVRGDQAVATHDPGGLEVLECSLGQFESALRRENHTLKRWLTDPRVFSGIGNAYSDEILHRAAISPVRLSQKLSAEEVSRLFDAVREVLLEWERRLIEDVAGSWPTKVTAFRPEMAVHGKYGQPCPVCGDPVQRIRYAKNETNYCATCQNDGRLLADRSLSRLLKKDWPRSLEELAELGGGADDSQAD